MTLEDAKKEFEVHFGIIENKLGFSLTAKKVKNGILVIKWYERNSWTDPTIEKKVLFSNGVIYENFKPIGNIHDKKEQP